MRSNLTITGVASDRMLCLRNDVESELGVDDDAKIDRIITAASLHIAELLGREPWLQTYLERLPGQGGIYLDLSRWPLKGDPASVTLGTGASPSTVTASTYSVGGPWRNRLYRASGWNLTGRDDPSSMPVNGDRSLDYNVTYSAGWIMPGQITEWSAAASVAANAWYSATSSASVRGLIFQADSGGGTTGGTEPTWPTAEEGTVVDNDITWTAYAQRVPESVEEAALMLAIHWYEGAMQAPANVQEEGGEGWRIRYREVSDAVSDAVKLLLAPYSSRMVRVA